MQLGGTQYTRDLQQTHWHLLVHKKTDQSACDVHAYYLRSNQSSTFVLIALMSIHIQSCPLVLYVFLRVFVCVCVWYLLVKYRGVRQDFIQAERLLIAYSEERGCVCERQTDRLLLCFKTPLCRIQMRHLSPCPTIIPMIY